MKRTLLVLALVPWVTLGCVTSQMWSDGFQTVTTPDGASQVPGYRPPRATKDTNGGVVLEYDAAQYRVGMFGGGTTMSRWQLVRITNDVPVGQLGPIAKLQGSNTNLTCPPARNEESFVLDRQTLPLLQRVWADGQLIYPDSECLLDDGGWRWYVPPDPVGNSAKEALLANETRRTSRPFVAAKIALTPLTVVPDAACVAAVVALSPVWIPALIVIGNGDF